MANTVLRLRYSYLLVVTLPCLSAYADWHQVTDVPQFPPRRGQSCVVHGGKIWVMGGSTNDPYLHEAKHQSDVWCTADMKHWAPVTRNAGWGVRDGCSCVSFKGKLWVFGGGPKYDTWSSVDGITWAETGIAMPWGGRSGQAAVAFDGAMWVMGGADSTLTHSFSDVWKSVDGITWTRLTGAAAWGSRYGMSLVVFGGKVWVVGGNRDYRTYLTDAWCSSDGVTWTQTSTGAPSPAGSGQALVVHQGKMWFISGFYREIWSSTDGLVWNRESDTPAWLPLYDYKTVVLGDRIWIIDGRGAYTSSSDGVSWDRSSRPAPWEDALLASATAWDGGCWLASADQFWGRRRPAQVWRTNDGYNWNLAKSSPPWGTTRCAAGLAEYDGRLWLVGGFNYQGEDSYWYNDVWSSGNGVDWTKVLAAAPWQERVAPGSLIAYDGKLWLVGGGGTRDVWNTTDGVNWARITAMVPWQSNEPQALVHNNRIWVRSEASNNLWWTTDGAHWQETFNEAPAGTQAALNGKIWIFEPLYDGRMWSSTDGETWTLSDVKVPFGDRIGHTTFVYNHRLWVTGGSGFQDLWYFQEQEVPFGFTVLPQGGWKEEGTPWQGRVEAVGLFAVPTYQWRKDGVDIPGATTETLAIPALTLTDTGSYTCILTDVAAGAHETPAARINVFPTNSLPTAGPLTLLAGCILLGFVALRHQEQ